MFKSDDSTMSLEVMRLLDIERDDLENVRKFSQFKSVLDYFKDMSDWRHQMLKLVSGSRKNNLKRMWDWVQLQREKEDKVKKLDPLLFAEDIEDEIKNKYISADGLARAREDVTKRRMEAEMRERTREQRKVLNKQTEEKESQATESGVETSKLLETEKTLNDIKSINNLLKEYE